MKELIFRFFLNFGLGQIGAKEMFFIFGNLLNYANIIQTKI